MVLPILSYSSEMCGYEQIGSIDRKSSYLKVSIPTSDEAVLGDVGRYPLSVYCSIICISYWLKIVKKSENRIVKQVYIMFKKLGEVGRKNWVSQIRFLLKELRFYYVWLHQGVENDQLFLEIF